MSRLFVAKQKPLLGHTVLSVLGVVIVLSCLLVIPMLGTWSLTPEVQAESKLSNIKAHQFVDNKLCIECHAEEAKQWKGSHHERAMGLATKENILGDFSDVTFTDAGVTSRFFQKDNRFFINTLDKDGKYKDFEVKYTFGYEPLQQYLVSMPDGGFQAFTVAWDTEKKVWFDLYPNEKFEPNNPLHWTSRSFNANSSCMECHTTNMSLNFEPSNQTYHSTWSEVNVSCQSCHGPGSKHVEWAKGKKEDKTNKGLMVNYVEMNAKALVESCARCHSRRFSVSENDSHGRSFFDDFMPETLRPELYHADGQIKDEVFVYGSFTQSKMYKAGVSCTDCHNPHTLKLKKQGNQLCTQCHQAQAPKEKFESLTEKTYDSEQHHFHKPNSKGTQCVSCHMPATNYMIVDPRRDHSFSIPRPDLSKQWNTPNACTNCHKDESFDWAITAMDKWYGDAWKERPNIAETISKARQGLSSAAPALIGLIQDKNQSAIVKATALELLATYDNQHTKVIVAALDDKEPMVRAAALRAMNNRVESGRIQAIASLLSDPVQGVRIEAAQLLVNMSQDLEVKQQKQFAKALDEYRESQLAMGDHAQGHLNIGDLHIKMGEHSVALEAYKTATKVDPMFAPAHSRLASFHYSSGNIQEAEQVFRKAIELAPSGDLYFSLGLLLIEKKEFEEALNFLEKAIVASPNHVGFHFNYGVLLFQLGKVEKSEAILLKAHQLDQKNVRTIQALIVLYRQQNNTAKAVEFMKLLQLMNQ